MWELDLMTFEAKFSNYWAGLLGYTIEEFEHSYDFWKNNVHRDDVMRVEKEFYDYILNYLETYEVVFRMKHKKGNYVWLKFDESIKRDLSGNSIKIIGNQSDGNESNKRKIKLEVAENKFRRITEKTSDIICQHTIDGVLYYVSKSSKEIVGYEPSEMINKIGLDFIHIDDFSVLKNACREFIKTAKNIPVTYRFRKKNNSYVWLETTSRNIINQDNVIIRIQTSSRDVIERIKREQELKMALANENEFNDNKFKFCP